MLRQRGHLFFTLAILLDTLTVSAAWFASYFVRFHLGLFAYAGPRPPGIEEFAQVLPAVLICILAALAACGLYRPPETNSLMKESRRLVGAAVLGWLAMLSILYYVSREPYSRVLLAIFLFASPLALIASRLLLRRLFFGLRKRGVGVRPAAMVGSGRLAQKVIRQIRKHPWVAERVHYVISDAELPAGRKVCGLPVLGRADEIPQCLREHPVDAVFVATKTLYPEKGEPVLESLGKFSVKVILVPDLPAMWTMNLAVGELDGVPVIHLRDSLIHGWHAVAKRAMDIAGSLLLLALLGVPMLFIAALVRLTSPGPALFKQERMGLGGKPFVLLKFRSMRMDAEDETGPVWATSDDPRRTWFGAFLRRTSLDELPQLLNILKGDMSLVGPRPERPCFVQQFMEQLPAYMLRHHVKAGLTGWAQVHGYRGRTSLRKRLQYDLYYINNWSLGLDLTILALTPFVGMMQKHAY